MQNRATPDIDFERCRARARTLRQRARASFYWRLVAFLRSLIAVTMMLGTFWMLPARNADCAACGLRAGMPHSGPSSH